MSDTGNPNEPNVGAMMGGYDQPLNTTARVGLKADTEAITKLKSEFSSLRAELEKVRKEMEGIAKASKKIKTPRSGTGSLGTNQIGDTPVAGGPFEPAEPGTQSGKPTRYQSEVSSLLSGTKGQKAIGATSMAATVINTGISAIEARADRSRDYALSADKMSLVYQQMYGLTQNQVMNQYRTPMTNFKLGAGGINALMSMQATTGISALQQASSVDALRTISGFSISAGQATNMISQLAAPDVANRMFMMGGTGLIGPGGQQRSTLQVMQGLVRSAGLNDPRLAKSALAQGSITRANLAMMGVTGEMQDMVIQYANQNNQYRQKGGRGMYDPSSKEGQKIMGIQDNFAMQAEETDRVRVQREEQFYRRQADNFSDLEKQTQTLTRAMGKLEDTLSGVIGKTISTKGSRGVGSAVGAVGGAAIGAFFGMPGVGAAVGGLAGNLIGGLFGGDPVEGDKTVPFGYGNQRVPISSLSSKATFGKLHPTFRDRLQKMFAANPAVGIGGGFRDPSQQETMFRQRYTPTTEKTDVFWNGQYWKHTSGAPAAPPGKSMHEIGLAADLVGDLDWVQKNAAKFGLKTFGGVNGEPWHVQPAELPNSRSEYEKGGAPWGTMGQPISPETKTPVTDHTGVSPASGAPVSSGGTLAGYSSQLSISEQIAATKGFVLGKRTPGKQQPTAGKASTSDGGTPTNATPGAGGGSGGEAVAKLLYAAGFRGQDLIDALAISWRESRWNPKSEVHDSDDDSYGLFQINMQPGRTNPEQNRKDWGIPNNEALLDASTNIRIAMEKYKWNKSHGRQPFADWAIAGNPLANTQGITAEATRIAKSVEDHGGDPVSVSNSPTRSNVSQSTSISGNHTFNISPNITLNGSGSNLDLQQIAKTVSRMIEQEIRSNNLRSL